MQNHIKVYFKRFNLGIDSICQCECCGKQGNVNSGFNIHHIVYRSQLGKDIIENLMCLCFDCHNGAHNCKISKEDLQNLHNEFLINN